MKDILLIYPLLGSMSSVVVDLPLSIIYAAAESNKSGYDVKLLDLRCIPDWESVLIDEIKNEYAIVGISVMTGMPLKNSIEISKIVRKFSPLSKVVWGGPHPTVLPETINESYIDYIICGYGSNALKCLADYLIKKTTNIYDIHSLVYKENGKIYSNKRCDKVEKLSFEDLPYDLIDIKSSKYKRGYSGQQIFSLFTSLGCPYQCAFCISPAAYKAINGCKWVAYSPEEVVAHIEYIINKYKMKHICFIDDTCFPDLKRMKKIFELILAKKMDITLEFRGARINEIDRMDDEFIKLLIKVGGRFLMVGVESGSERVLKIMKKGIYKEQIIRVNKKLANYPELMPYYNFVYGIPGEKYEDILETKELILQLVKDNPYCLIGYGGDWKPIPGSKLTEIAINEYGLKLPENTEEWIKIDSSDTGKIKHPWYSDNHDRFIRLLQISSFFIDKKFIKILKSKNILFFYIIKFITYVYRPIIKFRLKNNFAKFLIEYKIYYLIIKIINIKK